MSIAKVNQSNVYDVVVLGAGAAGLFCAFIAAQRGRKVLVLEKSNKVGKKILMSGGGRCNFTNYNIEPDNFISKNPHFCKAALKRYTQWDFIALVERYKIEYEERKHGQLFCKNSAKDILNMLLSECENSGVEIITHCDIQTIQALDVLNEEKKEQENKLQGKRYKIKCVNSERKITVHSESLVVATGALSIPTLGGSDLGYKLAHQYNLTLTERQAGLVPFMFSDYIKPICERLAGLAVDVEVKCGDRMFRENILFTHRGLSGPSILQISNYWSLGKTITINFLPDNHVSEWLISVKNKQGKNILKTILQKKLANGLVSELEALWWPEYKDKPIAEFTDKQLNEIGDKLNAWELKPSSTEGYRTAEVTLGGVDTDGISSKTMEAKKQAGLFFVGEVLDVTGHLGGYNFQWAWSSAYSAGLVV